jgi:peptidoglycan-N-acetylglucosamine deacetylase
MAAMRFFSGRLGRIRVILSIAGLVIVCAAAGYIGRYHKVPIQKAINPVYWIDHWRGLDRYVESEALLEHGDPSVREVAITIDDGPDPRYGPAIANYLYRAHVPATFFMVGIRVKQFPDVVKLIASDGFEIGNHTYDHQRLDALKPHEIASELRLCTEHLRQVTGREVFLMRPPGEQFNAKVLNVAKSLGYVTVDWTCGARDYDNESAPFIAGRILDRTENGSIILLHQDQPSTIGALPVIVAGLRAHGYRFVTISQMLDRLHAKLPPRPVGQ